MNPKFDDPLAAWRICEDAWSGWLQSDNYYVMHLSEATGNVPGTMAPLYSAGGRRRRAPDLQSQKSGKSEFWEIKFRTRADIDPLTGERIHWTTHAAFDDYLAIAKDTGCKVWIMVYEAPTASSAGRWLRAEVRELVGPGRTVTRYDQQGDELLVWTWPSSSMEIVPGPIVDITGATPSPFPVEGGDKHLDTPDLKPYERELRRPRSDATNESESQPSIPSGARFVASDPAVGLDILSRSLGLPSVPRYSVLRIGLGGTDLDDLFGLLQYGIRVFLISDHTANSTVDPTELSAFRDARMLEWAVINHVPESQRGTWVIDGNLPSELSSDMRAVLAMADDSGGINLGQYNIVHAPFGSDLLVTAGAGTGKTETMSERVVFLLATCGGAESGSEAGSKHPFDLRLDEIVFVTFSREASRQMRERIGRAIMLRQRLCRRSVLPTLAWMTQLGNAEVATIHSYAKHLVQTGGGALGLAPEVTVGKQTMAFREILRGVLSPHLVRLMNKFPGRIPAFHAWQEHIERIWSSLEDNGVELMSLTDEMAILPLVEWSSNGTPELTAEIEEATRKIVSEIAPRLRDHCLDNQSIRTAHLVPFALAAIRSQDNPRVKRPRYLFVDEFQDTDPLQMDLILEVRTRLSANLFVVGDIKQGIYRFRGAEGNAFDELTFRIEERGLTRFREYTLTRNFRSGAALLESLHPYFERWGSAGLLSYKPAEKLRPQIKPSDDSQRVMFSEVKRLDFADESARDVETWRGQAPEATIAVLCRQNWQARDVRDAVQKAGLPCELLVGGSFYTSPAVRELAILLAAVAEPNDDATLLQLCETRWSLGLLAGTPPQGIPVSGWLSDVQPLLNWRDRIVGLRQGNYIRSDLDPLRARVSSLGSLLNHVPVVAWVVECMRALAPEAAFASSAAEESEQRRYARCLDHLITLLDSNFKDGSVSLHRVISWLQLQIATNHTEDEPVEWSDLEGRTTALTVHKAKGLEFDRVLVPYTWTKFDTRGSAKSRVAILRNAQREPRVLWQWNPGSDSKNFSNVSADAQGMWAQDDEETAREETRLLYVALTRARERVIVYRSSQRTRAGSAASSWTDLLNGQD